MWIGEVIALQTSKNLLHFQIGTNSIAQISSSSCRPTNWHRFPFKDARFRLFIQFMTVALPLLLQVDVILSQVPDLVIDERPTLRDEIYQRRSQYPKASNQACKSRAFHNFTNHPLCVQLWLFRNSGSA